MVLQYDIVIIGGGPAGLAGRPSDDRSDPVEDEKGK